MKRAISFEAILVVLIGCCLAHVPSAAAAATDPVAVIAQQAGKAVGLCLQNDWRAARISVGRIVDRTAEMEDRIIRQKLPVSTLRVYNSLQFQLQQLTERASQPLQAALVANQISALAIDVDRPNLTALQYRLASMAYLAREIVLLPRFPDDYGLLKKRMAELQRQWSLARPLVVKRHAADAAARMDTLLTDLAHVRANAKIINTANSVLSALDALKSGGRP
ncbi:MAG: hypothetical protein P8076_12025 [Gammaproteobacteria bacterium]